MDYFLNYIFGVVGEGLVIGILFWAIAYITIESTSLGGAVKAALISELIGNIPYLFGVEPLEAPAIMMALVAAIIFTRLILRVGELTPLKASYGVAMTYFVLIAVVSCA